LAVRLTKPWRELSEANLSQVKGQLGVYQLGSQATGIVFIGCADARSLFGLRSELQKHLGAGLSFRIEVTTAYQTRYRELLMAFYADHGCYPPMNKLDELPKLGRLSPA